MKLTIFTTGGTIDKVYFDASSEFEVGESQIAHILREAMVSFDFEVRALMQKDSLDMTDADRARIVHACARSPEDRIVITHGTDTMVDTARAVAHGVTGKTVVLTGAMVPYAFGSSDGLFNLGSALSFAEVLPPGVYIAMNGQHFPWDRVRKNREAGVFELTEIAERTD